MNWLYVYVFFAGLYIGLHWNSYAVSQKHNSIVNKLKNINKEHKALINKRAKTIKELKEGNASLDKRHGDLLKENLDLKYKIDEMKTQNERYNQAVSGDSEVL